MSGKNLSAVLKSIGDLQLENRNIPEPLDHEVLLAIQSVGICGSDVHFWKSGRIGDYIVRDPMVLGHETSGIVKKVGANVKHLKPGDRVCVEPGIPCRRCEHCTLGRYNLCPEVKFNATPPVDGTLCRYYVHDADLCFKLPDNLSLDEGALMEPLSVAVYACRRSGVTAGKSILVTGAGPIGLLCMMTCKAMGATNICITDISGTRLEMAKQLGARRQVCVSGKDADEASKEIASKLGSMPDITIECSGAESCYRLALKATKPGGVLMMVGIGTPEVKVPLILASLREIDIRGIFRYANCYPTSIELASSGAIDLKPLITHHFKLEEAVKAFETAHSGVGIKVMIHCSE